MLNRCNIVALVGGGKNPKFPPNKVIIWDDAQNKVIQERSISENIINIKLKRDRLFVLSLKRIYVFSLKEMKLVDTIETFENKFGTFSVSLHPYKNIVSYPDKKRGGHLGVKNYEENKTYTFRAHNLFVACTEVNYDGSLISTASEKGTLIRIYDQKGNQLQELRRGSENAMIYSIAFDINNKFIAVSSDRGTVHIFFLNIKGTNGSNSKTFLGKVTNLFGIKNGYLDSERSFAQLRIQSPSVPICAFGPDHTIYAITKEGYFYQGKFDVNVQGDCIKEVEQTIND